MRDLFMAALGALSAYGVLILVIIVLKGREKTQRQILHGEFTGGEMGQGNMSRDEYTRHFDKFD